jgi:hypothetical protein
MELEHRTSNIELPTSNQDGLAAAGDLLDLLSEFVRAEEEIAYISCSCGAPGWDWRAEWRKEWPTSFDLVRRARAALLAHGRDVPPPEGDRPPALSPAREKILRLLREKEPCTVNQLAAAADLPRMSVYCSLRFLQEMGLAVNEPGSCQRGARPKIWRSLQPSSSAG